MNLSDQLQLGSIPEPQRSTILAALTEIVMGRVAMEAYDLMPPEAQAQLEAMDEETTSGEDVLKFMQAHVPDFDGLLNRVVEEERLELVDKTAQMQRLLNGHAR